jgi:hypothetical protein
LPRLVRVEGGGAERVFDGVVLDFDASVAEVNLE